MDKEKLKAVVSGRSRTVRRFMGNFPIGKQTVKRDKKIRERRVNAKSKSYVSTQYYKLHYFKNQRKPYCQKPLLSSVLIRIHATGCR